MTSTEAFGMSSAACLSSANATRALMHFFKIGPVSMPSAGGGRSGRSLYGTDGSNVMYEISVFIDKSARQVDRIDRSSRCV